MIEFPKLASVSVAQGTVPQQCAFHSSKRSSYSVFPCRGEISSHLRFSPDCGVSLCFLTAGSHQIKFRAQSRLVFSLLFRFFFLAFIVLSVVKCGGIEFIYLFFIASLF